MSEGVAIGMKTVLPKIIHHNQSGFIKYLYIGETALSIILQLKKKMRSLAAQVKLRVTNQVLKSFFSVFVFFVYISDGRAITRHITSPLATFFILDQKSNNRCV